MTDVPEFVINRKYKHESWQRPLLEAGKLDALFIWRNVASRTVGVTATSTADVHSNKPGDGRRGEGREVKSKR